MVILKGEKMVAECKDETGVARDGGVACPFFPHRGFRLELTGVEMIRPLCRHFGLCVGPTTIILEIIDGKIYMKLPTIHRPARSSP